MLVVVLARFERVFHLARERVIHRHACWNLDLVLPVVFLLDPRGDLRRDHRLGLRLRIVRDVEMNLLHAARCRWERWSLRRFPDSSFLPVPALWARNRVALAGL